MRLQDAAENKFSRTFMDGRVMITVWPNTPTSTNPNPFCWRIKYQNMCWVDYARDIPGADIYSILPDIARDVNQDVAIVIYEALGRRFNETLVGLQMEMRWPVQENMYTISNVTQIAFPPKENFTEELRLIEIEKWSRLHSHIYGEGLAERISREDMENSFEQMRDYILTDRYTPTITAWATPTAGIADCVNYLTSDEYERKKADGELNPNTVYLVFNGN